MIAVGDRFIFVLDRDFPEDVFRLEWQNGMPVSEINGRNSLPMP